MLFDKIVISLHHWFGEKVIYFDFLPALDGDTSKFSGEVDAKIQENLLDPEEWAFVGASTSTLKELKKFNEQVRFWSFSWKSFSYVVGEGGEKRMIEFF